MSKPFNYYAGYPGQQGTPKWVGILMCSLVAGMLLVSLTLAIRLVMPTRTAEASVAPPVAAQPVAAVNLAAPANSVLGVVPAPAAPVLVADATAAPEQHFSRHHGHHVGKHAAKIASHVAVAQNTKYKHAQLFAKTVSKRDRKSRDELDKMLGL